ncbi:MAG: VWA domain-containing protein [Opitutaceae bacterium]|jgi:Ca-activated chloride channel family protein
MTFYWPHAFWLLLIPLVLIALDLRRRRTATANAHPKITRAEAKHASLVLTPASGRSGGSRVRVLFYLGLVAATFALARPQWGRLEEPVFDQAREIIIALDLSRSMLAQDVKPSRLERARLLITSLLERLKGERVGLIVFSGTAFLQSPLSADYEILREFLPVLNPDYLPEGGTDYDALLDTTVSAFGTSNAADRFLIVLSDGEAQSETWQKHLGELKTKGIRVLSLGIGTAAGAIIPDGEGAFVKDEHGAVVLSKLNNTTLRELADKTDGVYTDASSWVDLSQLIENTVNQGRRGEFKETSHVRLAERYQWPLAAALVFLLLSFWREFPVRPKPRPLQLASPALKTAASLLLLVALIHPTSSARAAAKAAEASEADALAAPLTQLIGRLSRNDHPGAKDYAELARTTITYGERTKASQKTVPEGAVRDALAGVSAGAELDPKAADWPALREQLEALLPKKDPPPPKQDKPKPDEKKPDQNKDGQKSDQQDSKGDKGDQSKQSDQDKKDQSKPDQSKSDENKNGGGEKSSGSDQQQSDSQKNPDTKGQSAFGDMKKDPAEKKPQPQPGTAEKKPDQPETPESGEMQQVGGATEQTSTDPAKLDPNLAIPLQKLDQVKQGDSPARLFQILQGPPSDTPTPANKGKNW